MKRKLDIQFFADGDDMTLDDYLKDPKIQAEFDKKVESARKKWETKWEEQAKAEREEAERVARLSEEEKQQEAIRKLKQDKEESELSLKAYKLEVEAHKIASEKGLDLNLLKTIDYRKETTDSVTTIINDISNAFNKAVEEAVNEKLKQKDPQARGGTPRTSEKAYLDEKYKNNPYYTG